ncbi:MAG: alpha-mannosidase [Eubacterium sp.]|nr:alpha-mannosidase [Eubacterium sp.]
MENRIYTVATSHLDTVWRWELPKTIDVFLPDTLEKNFALLEKYPHYRFNFEGAFRYELIEEYYPEAFRMIQEYAAQGRWLPSGSAYENGDVNIPSPEAILRNFLYGNRYFQEKLGKTSTDIFLPDCFGFGYALPSIARQAHLKGFTTQKLSWGGAYERPFNIGLWRGVDGAKIYASLNPLSYRNRFEGDVRGDVRVIDKLAENGLQYGLPWTNCFYGTGDWGGAPTEESVQAVEQSIAANDTDKNTKVIAAGSDQIFNELDALAKQQRLVLPVWNNELVMRSHGAGAYTSRAMSKRLNAKNEVLADYAEKACVAADLLTSYQYPQHVLTAAWKRVIQHQFHDDITGTSTMLVYNNAWNDYFLSLSQFTNEYEGAVGAIANELDTAFCQESAVVVNNPCAFRRKEAVTAHVKLLHNTTYIKVLDSKGKEVPSQVTKKQGKEFDIVFLADVPPVGYRVYDVQAAEKPYAKATDLRITEHTLENEKYRLILNKNGDIASITDKKLQRQLLSAPLKLALLHDIGELNYPSWELRKEDLDAAPYGYANTPIFEIIEDGPARIALKVTRKLFSSKVVQVISLSSKGDDIRIENEIDWQERRAMLKAQFPLSCSNPQATYDLGLGAIVRGNNRHQLYEVPAQKWADITDHTGDFGVSILSDCKYGWDKPEDNTLRLTCLHTPAGAFTKNARQDLQDIGRNRFAFALCSHKGNVGSTTQTAAEAFCKPLAAFQTSSRREGSLSDSFSLLKISSKGVLLRAVKMAEDQNGIIIRLNEGTGKEKKNVSLSFFTDMTEAEEVFSSEEFRRPARLKDGRLIFDLKPYEIKSFRIKLNAKRNKAKESYKKLELPYNAIGITADDCKVNCILQGSGCSLPDELIPPSLTVHGITFKMPNAGMDKHIYIPRGEGIELPKGMTKLYILAAATLGDQTLTLKADNKERTLPIYDMKEPIGQWDMAGLAQTAKIKPAKLALELTHTHHPEGNLANQKACFFLYEVDIRNCKTLQMPEESKIAILAMTAVKRFSNTVLATSLTDTVEEGYRFGEIPPIDKLIDKADFVTIRAGKIQDQVKGGKGKGLKRNNPITNIIRSYTKSEW